MGLDPGMKCIKYLLFAFNFLFVLSGLAILITGVYCQIKYKDYLNFIGNAALSTPILLIVVGVIIFLVAFFGCCGAVKENKCLMITFSSLLSIIFILELAAGIAAYVYDDDVDDYIKGQMKDTLQHYKVSDQRNTWDVVQQDFKCCGINDPTDWRNGTGLGKDNLPDACCKERVDGCGTKGLAEDIVDEDDFYTEGCYKALKNFVRDNITIVGGVAVGIAFIQLIGIVLGCCLYKAIGEQYETV